MDRFRVYEGLRLYSFYGIIIKVRWEGKGIEDEIERFFSPYPFDKLGAFDSPFHIELNITDSDIPSTVPYGASEPVTVHELLICEKGDSIYLTDELSVFQIEAQSGRGVITLHRSFLEKSILVKYNFFLIGLIHLLSVRGVYDLHGAGLLKEGIGYLLLGESGSGKSSITLSLVHQGWHYQSDDALLLRQSEDRIESLAFRKQFYLDAVAVRHYPEIARHVRESGNGEHAKHFLDMHIFYPDQFCTSCMPKVLVFSSIVPQPGSRLVPIDKTSSLIKLMKQSESIYFNRRTVEMHVQTLKQLVYQADSFQLFAGRDLYDQPEKITDIFSEAGI